MITLSSLDTSQINASQNHCQCGTVDTNRCRTILVDWNLEAASLQTFRPHDQTVSVPIKNLASLLPAIEEHEIVAGHYVLTQCMRNDGIEPIEMLAHIGRLRVNKDPNPGR